MLNILKKHVDSHMTGGRHWPDTAVYLVAYSLKCWPTDWSKHHQFFDSLHELQTWRQNKKDWVLFEDNYFELDAVYEWKLGPNLLGSEEVKMLLT